MTLSSVPHLEEEGDHVPDALLPVVLVRPLHCRLDERLTRTGKAALVSGLCLSFSHIYVRRSLTTYPQPPPQRHGVRRRLAAQELAVLAADAEQACHTGQSAAIDRPPHRVLGVGGGKPPVTSVPYE